MEVVSTFLGWVLVLLSTVLFADITGIIKNVLFREKPIRTDCLQRLIGLKAIGLIAIYVLYIFLK